MTIHKWIRSFSRRSRLKLSTIQSLEAYSIQNTKECIDKILNSKKSIWIEVGFGDGKNIIYHALNQKEIVLIGCEPYLKGVSKTLINIEKHNIKNILIWVRDARELIINFPNNSIQKFFILFPDPWPKRSHNKRRLINIEFLSLLSDKITDTGSILLATDHQAYADHMLYSINKCNSLIYTEYYSADFPITKYYKKALICQSKIRFFKVEKNIKSKLMMEF